MALPKVELQRGTVDLSDGSTVEFRALLRREVLDLADAAKDGARELEPAMIAVATDTPLEDARAWWEAAPSDAVDALVEAIASLSGMDGKLGKGSDGS
jgi:hypothetical protein